jgi:hypothetical protein
MFNEQWFKVKWLAPSVLSNQVGYVFQIKKTSFGTYLVLDSALSTDNYQRSFSVSDGNA